MYRIEKKIITLCFYHIIALGIILVRLIYLQIIQSHELFERSRKNFLRVEKIMSRRGNILDCDGNLLATNKPITNLYWQGTGQRTLQNHQLTLLETLENILELPLRESSLFDAIKQAERSSQKLLLCSDISFEQLSKINEQCFLAPNIIINTQLKRCYPHKHIACHIIGYISRTFTMDLEGKMGLEKLFEPLLHGQEGELLKTINSIGSNLYQEEIKRALDGQDIITTIDLNLQIAAEEAFPDEFTGSLIVMDPRTGAIKALLSRPSYNPELFLDPIDPDNWKNLQHNQPFLNRAFGTCYPPASLFKLITLSAALEHNFISPDTKVYCNGHTRFRGRKYHCANKNGHGLLSITQAVAQSCNIILYEIAKKISIDSLADYATKFGLGQKTNILFPEAEGLIPSTSWKRKVKHESWWPGETLSAVIGQSYLLVTPLQMACMLGSIFTGYRVTPRILQAEPITKVPISIKKETRKFLKKAMQAVVDEGTAIRAGKIKNLRIRAKTGTAQVCSLEKQQNNEKEYLEHAWFGAHFRYKQEDPLILMLLIEHTGSSKTATKVAKKFLLNYIASLQQPKESLS